MNYVRYKSLYMRERESFCIVDARFIKQLSVLKCNTSFRALDSRATRRSGFSRTRSSSSSSFAWIHPFSHYAPIAMTRDNEIAHATKFISFSRDRTSGFVSRRVRIVQRVRVWRNRRFQEFRRRQYYANPTRVSRIHLAGTAVYLVITSFSFDNDHDMHLYSFR